MKGGVCEAYLKNEKYYLSFFELVNFQYENLLKNEFLIHR